MTYLLAASASSSFHDPLAVGIVAAGIFGLLGLTAGTLFLIQLLRTLLSRSSADAKGFRTLAIAWWVVCALGLVDGLILLSVHAKPQGLALVGAGLLFTAGMGWIADRTGRRLAQNTEETAPAATTSVRLPLLVVLAVLMIGGLAWWMIYRNRLHAIEAADQKARAHAEAEARKIAEEMEAERHARKGKLACQSLASSFDQLASVDLLREPFPDYVRIPEFGVAETDALVQRLAHGKLDANDVGPRNPAFPCLEEHRKSILGAYARGLSRLEIWTQGSAAAPLAQDALTQGLISASAARPLMQHLDGLALVAAQKKKPDEMVRATQLCALAEAMQHATASAPDVFAKGGCRKLASTSPN